MILDTILNSYLGSGGRRDNDSIIIHCPLDSHEDHNPSCRVREVANGFMVVCSCNENSAIWKKLNDELKLVQKHRGRPSKEAMNTARWLRTEAGPVFDIPKHVKVRERNYNYVNHYQYTTADGNFLNYMKVRYETPTGDKTYISYMYAEINDKGETKRAWIPRKPKDPQIYNMHRAHLDTVCIVEGEKAAKHAQELISIVGFISTDSGTSNICKYPWHELLELKQTVILWPDNDDPGHKWAWKGETNLYDILKAKGYNVKIVFTEVKPKADAADLNREAIALCLKQERDILSLRGNMLTQLGMAAAEMHMNEDVAKTVECGMFKVCDHCKFNYILAFTHPIDVLRYDPVMHNHCYVASEDVYINLSTMVPFNTKSFNSYYASQVVGNRLPAREFDDDPLLLRMQRRDFLPGQPLVVKDALNSALPVPYTMTDGTPDRWIRLLDHLVPDEKQKRFLLDFMAHMLQKPEIKMPYGILIMGPQGCGKSMLFRPIKEAYDRVHQVAVVSNSMLKSGKNGFLVGKKLIELQEIAIAGEGFSLPNEMKTWVDNDAMIPIDQKYGHQFMISNKFQIIAFSNADLPFKLEEGDRKWFVIRTDAARLNDQAWYTYDKYNEMIGPGYVDKIITWLMHRNVAEFNPVAPPPETAAHQDMIANSIPYMRQVRAILDDHEWPDIVVFEWIKRVVTADGLRLSDQALRQCMAKYGWSNLGRPIKVDGSVNKNFRPWSTRRHEMWEAASAELIRSEYKRNILNY